MEVKICGFPGYGSAGNDGSIGLKGSNNHYIKDDISNLESEVFNNSKCKENDLVYYKNSQYLISFKNDNGQVEVEKISDNHQFSDFNVKNSIIVGNYDVLLSDNLKSTEHIKILDPNAYLSLASNNGIFLDLKKNNNLLGNISLADNGNTTNFNFDCKNLLINDLYADYDDTTEEYNKILTESYGFSELKRLIESVSYKHINNDTVISFGYKPKNGSFRITECNYDALNANIMTSEYLIKDFNDISDNYVIYNSEDLFKIYFLSNYTGIEGNVIMGMFKLDIKKSKLKNVIISNEDNNDINDYNLVWTTNSRNILLKIDNDKIKNNYECKLELEFYDDSDLTVYFNSNEITDIVNTDVNKMSMLISFNDDEDQVYKINIGHIVYNISLKIISKPTFDSSIVINIDNNNYLQNSMFRNGVPVNGILETYNLHFNNTRINEQLECNITIKINNTDTDVKHSYYTIINNSEVSLLKLTNATEILNGELTTSHTLTFNSTSSEYKLLIYHEYDGAKYGLLNVSVKIDYNGNSVETLNRTLVIPWNLETFKPRKLISPDDYDLRIESVISRVSDKNSTNLYPVNMHSLKIKPISGSQVYKNNTLEKYKYIYTESYDQTVYAPDAFLMYGYLHDDYDNIFIYVNSDNEVYNRPSSQFAQCKVKYPIWSRVEPNIQIEYGKDIYFDTNIIPAGGSKYAIDDYNGIVVDLNYSEDYNNVTGDIYLTNNDSLGFIGWSLHKTEKDTDKSEYITTKYNFVGIDAIKLDSLQKNETMYGSYWEMEPKYVLADKSEQLFDCAVNILNIPKIYTPNGPVPYWINERYEEAMQLFNDKDYKISSSFTDEYDVY